MMEYPVRDRDAEKRQRPIEYRVKYEYLGRTIKTPVLTNIRSYDEALDRFFKMVDERRKNTTKIWKMSLYMGGQCVATVQLKLF